MPPAAAGAADAIPGGNESRAGGMDKNVRAPFAPSSEPHYLNWKLALATALPGFENTRPPDRLRRPGLFLIALDRVVEYLLGNPRLKPATNEYYHVACYGAFIAGSTTIELRKLLAAACVIDGIAPAFGQRLEAIVHSMESIDDGRRCTTATLFALDVVRERYFRPGTENLGPPEFPELLELYKDRVYDANIASAAKTIARKGFGGALRRNDRGREGGGGRRENFKTTRPVREPVAPRATFAKDATKDFGRSKAKVEPPPVDKAE
eukprot:jgi/Tetstr1/461534/TSEL_006640.t1